MSKTRTGSILWLGIAALGASSVCGVVQGATGTGQRIANNTPKFASTAKNMGAVDPSTAIDVSIWLNPHNRPEMDALAKELYDPTSPNYRHFLSKAEFMTRFAPTAAEAKTIQEYFAAHNLKVVTTGPDNFYVKAHGTVAAVQSAFHVDINNFEVNGKTFRGNTSDPYVDGAAGRLVASVYGLDSLEFSHPNKTAKVASNSRTPNKPGVNGPTSAAAGGMIPDFFSSTCFSDPETQTFSASGVDVTVKGNGYTKSVYGCGYTPAQIRTAYNLNALYKEGFDGTGQTIVILDWCGSPTIRHDANAFSARFGLPALTPANFSILEVPTPSTCAAPDAEINLDVEWAHAIAPGANITLVVPPSNSFQDIDEGLFYAVDYQLGNVLSGSYGAEELYVPSTILDTENLICETAAILSISLNFSSADDGDFTFGLPEYYSPSVSTPADSPYATSIGGVSLALTSTNAISWQTGWGTNENVLVGDGYIYDPPVPTGFPYSTFYFGSGGGPSGYFAKPTYQKSLKGHYRQIPDISWLADPYTGGVIAISEPNVYPTLQYESIGGTSLACPMFSALWAIANQEAGATSVGLGQAAPYLYSMPAATITDILPKASSSNVIEKIVDAGGTTVYSAASLIPPVPNPSKFYSVIWNPPLYQDTILDLSFGTDSGLTITTGWDNVTGLGVPNGKAFADYFKP